MNLFDKIHYLTTLITPASEDGLGPAINFKLGHYRQWFSLGSEGRDMRE